MGKARTVHPPTVKQPRDRAIIWKSPKVIEINGFLSRKQHNQFEAEGQVARV